MFKVGDVVALKDDPFQVQWAVTEVEGYGIYEIVKVKGRTGRVIWFTGNAIELWTVED